MFLHGTAQHSLLLTFQNHAGHREEKHLRSALTKIRLSPYLRKDGSAILVETAALIRERQAANAPMNDIVEMRFDNNAVEKLIKFYEIYGGHTNEDRIKKGISELDFTVYQRKTTGEHILVFTQDYINEINGTKSL
jgi:hypothetical protein